jgi:1-acyl-sn-glycerol-3-phosphate acyltransferase
MFDIPALQAAFPNHAGIVFKKELVKIPIFGWQLYVGPYVVIDRENPEKALKSIKRAKWLMEKKKVSACLFAEGTRSKTGEVQPFKRGAFHLASQIKYPIIPISISGTSKIMPKGKFKINPGTITVYFDKPIDTSNLNNKKDELEMMEKVRSIIIQKMEN